MNLYLKLGVLFATIALVFYSIFAARMRKKADASRADCVLQTTGLDFDIAGTVLMIIGSERIPLTVHGVIGYSALAAMLVKTALVWAHALKGVPQPARARLFGNLAYAWWIVAFVAGGIIAMAGVGR